MFPIGLIVLILASATEGAPLSLTSTGTRTANTATITAESDDAITVEFGLTDWPNVTFKADGHSWDWSTFAGMAVDVYNPGDETVLLYFRIDNADADGQNNCVVHNQFIGPRSTVRVAGCFRPGYAGPFWGMRGVPIFGPIGLHSGMDPSRVTAFQFFLDVPTRATTLTFSNLRLIGSDKEFATQCPLPFVDPYGQYAHADWPGKVDSDEALAAQRMAEAGALAQGGMLADRDAYGGWLAGPKLEATGWFRTVKRDGRWWLVTPAGHLFFSLGMNGMQLKERTFVDGRDGWFSWLPDEAEGPYACCFDYERDAFAMAETIDGEGRTFNFHMANLIRKYGEDWEAGWAVTSLTRMKHWGFNTIADSGHAKLMQANSVPFTAGIGFEDGIPDIEGGKGYWGKPKDVFSPAFAEIVEASVIEETAPYKDSPYCIGYFVDNELAWYGIARGALASPPTQPARLAFVSMLQARHGEGGLAAVCAAWEVTAADWDALRVPDTVNAACRKDIVAFESLYATRYFETVRDALRRHAPNQLYLGCRFAGRPPLHIEKACAAAVDVMSYNLYFDTIPPDLFGDAGFDKPFVLGEFHFGAMDRGMFHPGLYGAADQAGRGAKYAAYVRSALSHPDCIGAHWFQYVDEPITGRWFDGENYNIGFVSVTDTPYLELVQAARAIHAEAYPIRFGAR